MQITVNNKIYIQNPTPAIMDYCKNELILDNPEYEKKNRMGLWTGSTPREIWLYEKLADMVILPFGCLRNIWRLCVRGVQWKVEFGEIRHVDYKSEIKLYDYQEKAVNEAISGKNGVLVMPCGAGKTQCGLEIISRIGGRALWLTHTHDLLVQSKERAISVLEGVKCGTITAGKVDIGEHITFATVQTMAKIDLSAYRDAFDIIIVDEAQHCCGTPSRVTMFYKVVSSLCARYKFGLTATPKRADGLQACMFALLGDKIHEVKKEEVAHTTCPVKVSQIPTCWMPDYDEILMGDGTIDYHKVIDSMIHDDGRYKIVMKKIAELDEPTIVLANRVDYLQRLCESMRLFGKRVRCLSGMWQSKKENADRKAALEKLNNGEIDAIFATYQLAKEGLDVPNLRYVVFATPEKDETTVIQSVGRVGRKAEGKECGTVIDFVDDFGMYKNWASIRRGFYRKINAEII